jgi:signal peptidase I
MLIKRVIGLPGEQVTVANGQVHIDGSTLAETWASAQTTPDSDDLVPDHAVWVLGDNRALSSADSRNIGPVALGGIAWKALAIYWPASRAAAL